MFGRIVLFIFLLLVSAIALVAVLVVDTAPAVSRVSSQQVDNADTVHELLRQIKTSLSDRHSQQTVAVSQAQFESLMGFAQRALPGFNGAVDVSAGQTEISASVALPAPADGYFINLSALILPGQGVDIEHVQIGNLMLPGDKTLAAAVWLVDKFTKSDVASTAANQITQITMTDERLVLDMRPLDELLQQIDVARENVSSGVDELGTLTTDYLAYVNSSPLGSSPTPQSVASYINLVFSRANELSADDTRVMHNQAALLSLAIFLGDHRIAGLAGASHPAGVASESKAPAVLAQRNDLARHFTISAALQILSQQNMTMAIGEFKELMDRARGGSGYSFVDLAADMSGIEFAKAASESDSALKLQKLAVKGLKERDILPFIGGLPEGLSKAEFSYRYSEVDSPAYRKQVAEIQQRIDNLPIYR
ncbi:hypothetical protein [Alteromonas lipolytica]|uniref:Uncharacterized protein n=1 Tax=Alteromonas lipolytica TaxID=1856405 RepID=A0A1E8FEZ1_9ALTE|nr:hypothetical protein [Alteromonas lipolytica]OFI34481.1 hypothetical protein BFC17_17760 [Alteromonas lipolytica]GGF84911.1 hypothetical protein GCM10011338_41550 [Alteromonas lipolytica]